jgi:hypothetical protein
MRAVNQLSLNEFKEQIKNSIQRKVNGQSFEIYNIGWFCNIWNSFLITQKMGIKNENAIYIYVFCCIEISEKHITAGLKFQEDVHEVCDLFTDVITCAYTVEDNLMRVLVRCIPNLGHYLGIDCWFVVDKIGFGVDLMECMQSGGAVLDASVRDNVQDSVQDSIACGWYQMCWVGNDCCCVAFGLY